MLIARLIRGRERDSGTRMTLRLFLLASVMAGTLAAIAPASAGTLNPQSAWAVTRVGAKAPGAAPYCALARRFDNNVIMTFARNTNDEVSVAIDFQQPVFSDDQSVPVSLNTGVGEARDFLLKPASNKAIVARIGSDSKFFNELEAGGGMDASVMGQDYRFVMNDMGDANRQLNQCLGALNYGAPEEAGMDDKIAALQDQIQTLKTQRTAMASDMGKENYSTQLRNAAGGENADLASKISDLQMQNLALRDTMENQRSEYDNLQTKTLEDKSRVALLEETQDQLRRAQEDTKKFRDDLYTTQMRQDDLLQKLDKYSSEQTKRQELEKHLEIVRAENEKLIKSLKDEKERLELVKSAQDAMLAQQQQELSKTKQELAQTSSERDTFKTRLKEYEGIKDKLTALATEQKQLGSTVTALQTEKNDLTDKLSAERNRLVEIQANKKKLEEQVSTTAQEKEKLAKLLDEEKAKQKAVEDIETQLADVQAKQKELTAKVAGLEDEKKALQTQVNELEGRVKQVEEEKKKVSEDLAAAQTEKQKLAQSVEQTTQEKVSIAADLEDAQQLASMQSETIDTLTVKQKGLLSQVTSLEGEKKDLMSQLDQQKTQLASLQSEAKTRRDVDFELTNVQEQIKQLSKERDDARAALQAEKDKNIQMVSAGTEDAGMRALYTQAEELEYQRVDLNSALEFERAKNLNEANPAAGAEASSLSEMKASLAAIQAERDEYKRLLESERSRAQQLQGLADAAGAKETVGEMNTRIKTLESENVNLLRELEYERAKQGDVTTASVNTTGKGDIVTVTRLRDEVKRLQGSSQALETKQGELLAQVRMLEAEKQKMAQAQPPVVTAAPQNDAEKNQLKAQIAALQAEKSSLDQMLAQRDAAAKTAATTAVSAQNANNQVAEAAQRQAVKAQQDADNLRAQLEQAQTLLATRQAQAAAAPVETAYINTVPVVQTEAYAKPAAVAVPSADPMATMAPVRNVESDLRQLLQSARLDLASFGPVTIPAASNVQAWRWKAGSVTGNAESTPAPDAQTQSAVIESFLAKAKSRCPGDFAVIENSRSQSARGMVVSTDIACVAGANGVAAAISFIQFGDRLVTIAHEASTADMPDAMAARDKLVQAAMTSR